MPMSNSPNPLTFGLLPEPEGRTASFVASTLANLTVLSLILIVSLTARTVIQRHYEMTQLFAPTQPPPPVKVKPPAMPKLPPPPAPPKVTMEAPKIQLPKPKPAPKPIQMEARVKLPEIRQAKPNIILAPQPKAALTAAMPAQAPQERASTAPVHLGQLFGVTPNPNATRPATVAAIGNPYGGMQGPAVAPHGVVGSTGIGNGLRSGSNAGVVGRVASAGIPGDSNVARTNYGKVASAGIPGVTHTAAVSRADERPASTDLEVLSKPPVQYTSEARKLKVQGDVVLRVTFLASGQVVVDGVVHGLGHGLDAEARRVAEQIRFRPATRDGRPVDLTTNIVISFQLA